MLGPRAVESISNELELAGVEVVSAVEVDVQRDHVPTVVLKPSGQRLEVDRVLVLPLLHGRRIPGVPADAAGFVEVDEALSCTRSSERVGSRSRGTAFDLLD